ncbi:hypothetical protein AVEN_183396-1, partial [Araneus ventricosus]
MPPTTPQRKSRFQDGYRSSPRAISPPTPHGGPFWLPPTASNTSR